MKYKEGKDQFFSAEYIFSNLTFFLYLWLVKCRYHFWIMYVLQFYYVVYLCNVTIKLLFVQMDTLADKTESLNLQHDNKSNSKLSRSKKQRSKVSWN